MKQEVLEEWDEKRGLSRLEADERGYSRRITVDVLGRLGKTSLRSTERPDRISTL